MEFFPVHIIAPYAFKGFREGDNIWLSRMTAFVGPNGSGKTTILQAIEVILGLLGQPLDRYLPTISVERLGRKGAVRLGLAAEEFRLDLELRLDGQFRLTTAGATGHFHREGSLQTEVLPTELLYETHQFESGELARFSMLRLEPGCISAASYSEEAVPEVAADGSGVASVLADMAVSAPERFAAIQEQVRSIIPELVRIRLVRAPVERVETEIVRIDDQAIERKRTQTYWGHRMVLDMRSRDGIDAEAASEGTLIAIALLTILNQPNPPRLLLIDDIERGLHPVAQGRLVELLRQVIAARPEEDSLQIVMTSHSPFLIDHLRPEEVYLTDIDPETGGALCARLTEHPEFDQWKDSLGTGEFWSTFGEGWIHERKAASANDG